MISDSYSMSRDPLIYEDPLVFNPDRWTREGRMEKAFAHLPFGFSPRACYGEAHVMCSCLRLAIHCVAI